MRKKNIFFVKKLINGKNYCEHVRFGVKGFYLDLNIGKVLGNCEGIFEF